MNSILVGYTGFVGSNICAKYQFDGLFNSKNILDAFGTNPDLLIFAGLPAEKFIANKDPVGDLAKINTAIENIKKINPKQIVLISTIDIYDSPVEVNEYFYPNKDILEPYGKDRLILEDFIEQHFNKHLIVRLPGLYGKNIKKNFIYDLIHYIPSLLNEKKYNELSIQSKLIAEKYQKQDNGFYKCIAEISELKLLKSEFEQIGFSALNFTDSRGIFQFYNLANLWNDIKIALDNNIQKLNLATEPVIISDLYEYICGQEFKNEFLEHKKIPLYAFKSKYDKVFNGKDGYLYSKDYVLKTIKSFVEEEQNAVFNI